MSQSFMWQESKLEPSSDSENYTLPFMHTDTKLNDPQSLHPRKSQARNKTIPTQHISSINFPNAILYLKTFLKLFWGFSSIKLLNYILCN